MHLICWSSIHLTDLISGNRTFLSLIRSMISWLAISIWLILSMRSQLRRWKIHFIFSWFDVGKPFERLKELLSFHKHFPLFLFVCWIVLGLLMLSMKASRSFICLRCTNLVRSWWKMNLIGSRKAILLRQVLVDLKIWNWRRMNGFGVLKKRKEFFLLIVDVFENQRSH